MIVLCWNCQGLGTPLTGQALRAEVACDKPNLVLLMETKNQEPVILRTKRQLKYQNYFVVNPVGCAGGLAIMWDSDISVQTETATQECINLICTEVGGRNKMRISHSCTEFLLRETEIVG